MTKKKPKATNCEMCGNYVYDDDYGYYVCEMDLDEDDASSSRAASTAVPISSTGTNIGS